MDHKIFRYGLIQGTRGFSSLNNDNVAYLTRNGTVGSVRNDDERFLAVLQSQLHRFDIEKQHIQYISTKSGFEPLTYALDDSDIYTILFDPTFNRPELLHVDSQRPDNAISRDVSAELRVSSVSNDRQDSHDIDTHDQPTNNITRISAQVLRPANVEEIEKRMQACLRENRTSPYELTELREMFPGHEPETLCRVWYRVRSRLRKKTRTALSSLRG
ncbi:hypothetical protein IWW34DRAFT_637515 [Fusarium oxysporum f. sp. albedinis]|nr:hypothetical protein IWW34DRAFT_637515 [Fusarium oxysporum f. sp. albedinis]